MTMTKRELLELGKVRPKHWLGLIACPLASCNGAFLQFGRLRVRYYRCIRWYGNWCWDAYRVSVIDAARILNYLRRQKYWDADAAWCELFDPWKAGELTADHLRIAFPS